MSVNDENSTLCRLCGGQGRITGGFRYRESMHPEMRSCPACCGDGRNHHRIDNWYDWIVPRIVDAEVLVRRGTTGLSRALVAIASEVAGFDERTPLGRYAITSFCGLVAYERQKRVAASPDLKELLSPTRYGAGMISGRQLRDPDLDLEKFIANVFGTDRNNEEERM